MNQNLKSVSERIAGAIITFALAHMGQEFFMEELRAFLASEGIQCAPASPDRVLRSLRAEGRVFYTLISRAQSKYRIDAVVENPTPVATEELAIA